jgi:hypothetical protein
MRRGIVSRNLGVGLLEGGEAATGAAPTPTRHAREVHPVALAFGRMVKSTRLSGFLDAASDGCSSSWNKIKASFAVRPHTT